MADSTARPRLLNLALAENRVIGLFLTSPTSTEGRFCCIALEGDAITLCDGLGAAPRRGLASTAIREVKTAVTQLRAVEALLIAILCESADPWVRECGLKHAASRTSIAWSDSSMALCESWVRLAVLGVDPVVPGLPLFNAGHFPPSSSVAQHMAALRDASQVAVSASSVLPRLQCDAIAYLRRGSFVCLSTAPEDGAWPGVQGVAWSSDDLGLSSEGGPRAPIRMVRWTSARSGLLAAEDFLSHRQESRALANLLEAAGAVPPGFESCSGLGSLAGTAAGRTDCTAVAPVLFDRQAVPEYILGGSLSRAAAVGVFLQLQTQRHHASTSSALRQQIAMSAGGDIDGVANDVDTACVAQEEQRRAILQDASVRDSRSARMQHMVDTCLARNARVIVQITAATK
jgi:hypothetical protein